MCITEELSPLLTSEKKSYDGRYKESETSIRREEREQEEKKDWRVVVAAMFALFTLNGIEYGFGCLMEPLMLETGLGRSTISLIGSTQVALSAFTAPLASAMISRLGMRRISIIGSLAASLGLLCSSLSSSQVTKHKKFTIRREAESLQIRDRKG